MNLRRPVPNVEERLGSLAVTLDDLIELETLLPPSDGYYRRISAGPYEVDSVEDLRSSSEEMLPDFSVAVTGLRVFIYPGWSSVASSSEDMNDSARKIADFLRGHRVRRLAGFETPARVAWFVAWMFIYFGIVRLAIAAYGQMDTDDGSTVVTFVVSVLFVIGWMALHNFVSRRLPDRMPVTLKPPQRWIDRHGMALSIAVATVLGIAAIVATIVTA